MFLFILGRSPIWPLLPPAEAVSCPLCSRARTFNSAERTTEIPDQATIDKMCASTACNTLLADVKAMNLEECQLPVGVGSNLKADLVVYVPSNCPSTSAPSPDSPATNAPVVDTPTTPDNSTSQAEHTAALTKTPIAC
ncbi:hypothetical protein PInf_002870 [Phytophthora infestans]|nr:hypothetical protein PInf_002870 [Phytophthora infestans]